MNKYRISIHGENFWMLNDGEKTSMGFYATRWVEASSLEKAEMIAIEIIKNDQELREAIINERDNPPMLFIEEIDEVKRFPDVNLPGTGYSFYPETE